MFGPGEFIQERYVSWYETTYINAHLDFKELSSYKPNDNNTYQITKKVLL